MDPISHGVLYHRTLGDLLWIGAVYVTGVLGLSWLHTLLPIAEWQSYCRRLSLLHVINENANRRLKKKKSLIGIHEA